jgi:hypothetical protein
MAAGSTYTPIATTTLGSAQASYTFSSIPSTYTDLVIISNHGVSTATANFYVRVNGDSATNYSSTTLKGNGSSASSARLSNINRIVFDGDGASTSITNVNVINFQNYANSTTYKTVFGRSNDATYSTAAIVGLWRSTSAITSITIGIDGYNFITGSTFTLYGIQAA